MSEPGHLPSRRLVAADLACARGGRQIFTGIDFSAGPGDLVLLRGPNGAGKTTLLYCLAGFLPHEGHIAWSGHPADSPPSEDMHFIGHLPAVKPHLTLRENLGFWARLNGGDAGTVDNALAAVRLAHLAGLETAILSAGQTRRLSLARLLCAPRPVWLLDEPTAALDRQGEAWLLDLLSAHLQAGGLAIAATHLDLPVTGARHKVIDMSPGR